MAVEKGPRPEEANTSQVPPMALLRPLYGPVVPWRQTLEARRGGPDQRDRELRAIMAEPVKLFDR